MKCVYVIFMNSCYGDEEVELITDESKKAEKYLTDKGYKLDEIHTSDKEKGYSRDISRTDYYADAYIRRVILNIPVKWQ